MMYYDCVGEVEKSECEVNVNADGGLGWKDEMQATQDKTGG